MSGSTPPPLRPGARVSIYRVIRRIGSGGAGDAYLVENTDLNRVECLKMLTRATADGRFSEARAAVAASHPGVAGVFATGRLDGVPWYTMHYAAGGDLRRYLGALPAGADRAAAALPLLRDIATTLDYLHELATPILHGDIKPGNILVDTGSRTPPRGLLADFGLAHIGDRATVGSAGASPGYLSPERPFGAPPRRSDDLYAFACTAFEAITGHRAFTIPRAAEAEPATRIGAYRAAHRDPRRPVPSDHDPGLSRYDPVFRRALALDPAERHRRATALVEDLTAAQARSGIRRRRMARGIGAALAAAALLAVGGALAPRALPGQLGPVRCPDLDPVTTNRILLPADPVYASAFADTGVADPEHLPAQCRFKYLGGVPGGYLPPSAETYVFVFDSERRTIRADRDTMIRELSAGREITPVNFANRTLGDSGHPLFTAKVITEDAAAGSGEEDAGAVSACVLTAEDEPLTLVEVHPGFRGRQNGIGGGDSAQDTMCWGSVQLLRAWDRGS